MLELGAKVDRSMRDLQWPPRASPSSPESLPAQVVPGDSKQLLTEGRGKTKYRPPELTLDVGQESHVKCRFTLYSRGESTASQSATPTSQTQQPVGASASSPPASPAQPKVGQSTSSAKGSPGGATLQPKVSNEVVISVEH